MIGGRGRGSVCPLGRLAVATVSSRDRVSCWSSLGGWGGQRDDERATLPGLVANRDLAAMSGYRLARDSQPQSGATTIVPALHKWLEEFLGIVRRKPSAFVLDLHH